MKKHTAGELVPAAADHRLRLGFVVGKIRQPVGKSAVAQDPFEGGVKKADQAGEAAKILFQKQVAAP